MTLYVVQPTLYNVLTEYSGTLLIRTLVGLKKVPLFQELFFGKEKGVLRCSHFGGVLREVF
jgi:hypothetical protein